MTILGATGKTGGQLARLAVAQGDWKVHTAGRRPAQVGRHRYLDWDDPDTWEPAVDGSDAVYVIVPFTQPGAAERTATLISALGSMDVGKVVLLSSLDAESAGPRDPLKRAEAAATALRQPTAIIRPTWFMDNFVAGSFAPMVADGVLRLPVGQGAIPLVDVRDIAAVALRALTAEEVTGVLPVTGPESITHHEVARALSAAARRKIRYEPLEPKPFIDYMISRGFGHDYAGFLAVALDQVAQGALTIPVHDTTDRLLGRRAHSINEFAAHHATTLT